MATNRLRIHNLRTTPRNIPATGGSLTVEYEARTSQGPATASVKYSVASGPYELTQGKTGSHDVSTSETTIRHPIRVRRTSGEPVSYFQLQIDATIPGDISQSHRCFVWIDDPLAVQVKNLRVTRDLTQRDLAEEVGISRSRISAVERGESISLELEEAIAGVIDHE